MNAVANRKLMFEHSLFKECICSKGLGDEGE